MNVTMYKEAIKRINVRNSVKMLGVYISPSLSRKDEFVCAKENMKHSIKKLMKAYMRLHKFHLYFNACI